MMMSIIREKSVLTMNDDVMGEGMRVWGEYKAQMMKDLYVPFLTNGEQT